MFYNCLGIIHSVDLLPHPNECTSLVLYTFAPPVLSTTLFKNLLSSSVESDEMLARLARLARSLYKRMNFSSRTATISRPVITRSVREEVRTTFLHDIVSVCIEYDIPDELIINVDQTPSKYVATDKITMAENNSRHVSKKGMNDKRQITATFGKTLAGDILPFQLIYKG